MRHGHRSKAGEGKQGRSNCWNNFIMLSHGILMHFTLMSGYVNRDDSYYLTAIFKSVDGIITGTNIQITGLKGSFFSLLILYLGTFLGNTIFAIQSAIVIIADSAAGVISECLLCGNFVELVSCGSPGYSENDRTIEDTLEGITIISTLLRFVTGERN